MVQTFRKWASTKCQHADYINTASSAQIQQLLFGEFENSELKNRVREFEYEKPEDLFQEETKSAMEKNPYAHLKIAELKALCKERNLKAMGKKSDLISRLLYSNDSPNISEIDYSKMKMAELKAECIQRKLSDSGKKSDMISRLKEFDQRKRLEGGSIAMGLSPEGSCISRKKINL